MSQLEDLLAFQIKAAKLPEPIREYKALPNRRFRWDFAWPEFEILLEVQGGTWVKSGHTSGKGIARDIEKSNLAVLSGWTCFGATGDMIKSGQTLKMLQEYFSRVV